MLIRRAALADGRLADIRVGEQITDVAPQLDRRRGEDEFDADHGAVLPGLHDHHLHVRAAAAALRSVAVGPPRVNDAGQFAAALRSALPDADGWVRAVGYHESVAGDLDHAVLDRIVGSTPLRVQHRSGVLWFLNSAGLARVGIAGHPDGRLRSDDRRWSASLPRLQPDLAAFGALLTRYGVTGVTDATPDLQDAAALAAALPVRLHALAPGKRILHDDELDLDELTAWITARHADGVPVALHCVTVPQLVVAVSALAAAGRQPRDRIEHAAMVPDDMVADLVGVTVVTQPGFVAERGREYVADVPADEWPQLWRVATLQAAGVPVAGSTDAPFGSPDPWAAMRAAVSRRTAAGIVLGERESVTAATALAMFSGHAADPCRPRRIAPGEPGDLCVLGPPPDEALRALASDMVTATVVGGRLVHG
ncbi:amidohydrolase family protein [Mycobacterium sp. MYCO198283]|uniref:amidohydrolase family protein n=1 Tax=Mycobacterium sp. MYCO198283 TaxID=2883505 RepID=UPI001E4E23DF|nr:amidohydrolase family protein [Mycobacterium sp. MYCO198283]MCG5432019.1 amidohydrolase family protein [Mycobacterium sp. MYCO198283]